ncbi:MAG TPA: EamA family transporter [Prolixibacteraceae bacterium]|nr:EamA family transporter [Prolixibacteraceae bacterium]
MKRFALITGLLSGFLFGIATPLSKLLLSNLNYFQLAGLLYLGAGLAMLPSVLRNNSGLRILFQSNSRLNILGIIFFGGIMGPLLLLGGLQTANAASVSIWLNMELVATALLGILFFKDTLDKYAVMGVILTVMAGTITSLGEGLSGVTSGLLITAACFCWGVDNHLTALTDGATPQTVTFIKGMVAGTVNFIIGCIIATQSVEMETVFPAVILGAFSYGISIVLYVTSAQHLGATRSQILFSTAPLWGVLLSWLFYADAFQWVHVLSMVLLAAAVIVTNIFSHNHLHTHRAMEHIHYHRHNDGHHNHQHDEPVPEGKWHSHLHTHQPITHQHPHQPDLHHRHEHES